MATLPATFLSQTVFTALPQMFMPTRKVFTASLEITGTLRNALRSRPGACRIPLQQAPQLRRCFQAPRMQSAAVKAAAGTRSLSTAPLHAELEEVKSSSSPKFLSADFNQQKRMVTVEWSDGIQSQYPFIWLRDNCPCPNCFHPGSTTRRLRIKELDLDIMAENVQIINDGGDMQLTWHDGHNSIYKARWLKDRSFTPEVKERRKIAYKSKPRLWGAELQDSEPTFIYNNIMKDDKEFYSFLKTLEVNGFVVVKSTPKTRGMFQALADRIGVMKTTHYGAEWTIRSVAEGNTLGNTDVEIGLHTDLPYYNHSPGVVGFHCVSQHVGMGGDSMFCDAFNVAKQIKQEDPDAYRILTTVPIDFWDYGNDYLRFYKLSRVPIFMVDSEGEVEKVHHSSFSRDSFLNVDLDQVYEVYRALKVFDDRCHHPVNMIRMKIQPGTMVLLDNTRVLHGRKKQEGPAVGTRHFQGGYLDWDEIRSRMRILREKLDYDQW